jgi:hypothetical protein
LILPIIVSQSIAQGLFLEKGAKGFSLGREISKNSNSNESGFNFVFSLNNIDIGITTGKASFSKNNNIPYPRGSSIGAYLSFYSGKGDTAVQLPTELFLSYEYLTYSSSNSYYSGSDLTAKLISLGISIFKKISTHNPMIIPKARILCNISIHNFTSIATIDASYIINDPMYKVATFSGIFDINFALKLSPNLMFFIDPGLAFNYRKETSYNLSSGLILYRN